MAIFSKGRTIICILIKKKWSCWSELPQNHSSPLSPEPWVSAYTHQLPLPGAGGGFHLLTVESIPSYFLLPHQLSPLLDVPSTSSFSYFSCLRWTISSFSKLTIFLKPTSLSRYKSIYLFVFMVKVLKTDGICCHVFIVHLLCQLP